MITHKPALIFLVRTGGAAYPRDERSLALGNRREQGAETEDIIMLAEVIGRILEQLAEILPQQAIDALLALLG